MLSNVMLSDVMLSVAYICMLSVVLQSENMLGFEYCNCMLSVIILRREDT